MARGQAAVGWACGGDQPASASCDSDPLFPSPVFRFIAVGQIRVTCLVAKGDCGELFSFSLS